MHNIIIRDIDKQQSKLCRLAVAFCLNKFIPRMNVEVVVQGVNGLLSDNDEYGNLEYETDDNYRPRYFTIEVDDSLPDGMFLRTIMHEMVHVKQYAKGEFKEYSRPSNMRRWHSEYFEDSKYDYWEQPWEIEAHGREVGLCVMFKSQYYAYSDIDV